MSDSPSMEENNSEIEILALNWSFWRPGGVDTELRDTKVAPKNVIERKKAS